MSESIRCYLRHFTQEEPVKLLMIPLALIWLGCCLAAFVY